MKIKTCEWCGTTFQAQRSTAKYCSDRCRVSAHRYKPYEECLDAKERAISNITTMMKTFKRERHLCPEIDEMLVEIANYISEFTRENYKIVVEEQNRRLL